MSCRSWMVAIVAARFIFAQTVPPPALAGHFEEDASALLSRARARVLDSIRNLPNYTCLETINRSYYVLPPEKHNSHMMTEYHPANACSGNGEGHLALDAQDRLRVEVAVADEGEMQSWPGASRFDTAAFDQMIPFGPLHTGSFGPALFDVFANPGTQIQFIARRTVGPQDVFEYSFRVPRNASHNRVKGRHGWDLTAFSGRFEIVSPTAELLQLAYETDPLQPDTNMCRAKISNDYHLLHIGDGEFRIPLRSEFETFDTDGGKTDSVTEFSACREYTTESKLSFGDPQTSGAGLETTPQPVAVANPIVLPPGLALTLAMIGATDLGTAAAGDRVSARVVHPVRAPGSKKVWVPANAIARGRILVMRHELRTSEFLLSLRFDTLETNGVVSPLSIRVAREIKAEWRDPGGLIFRGNEFSLPTPALTEPGSRFVFAAKSGRYVIRPGFQSKWTTVAP